MLYIWALKLKYNTVPFHIKLILIFIFFFSFLSCKVKKDPKILTNEEVDSMRGITTKTYNYETTITEKDKKYFANKLDVEPETITNEKLYAFIKSWDGTTYLYGGEDKNGIDCSNLMQRLYKQVYNVSLKRTSAEMGIDKRKMKFYDTSNKLKEGDLILFRNNEEKLFSHVGIYLRNDMFFAASSADGCTISSLKKSYWKKSFKSFGRLK